MLGESLPNVEAAEVGNEKPPIEENEVPDDNDIPEATPENDSG